MKTFYEFIYCYCGCGFTRSKFKIVGNREFRTIKRYFIKGHENVGKKYSKERKQKISKAHIGKILSTETRQRISKSHIGLRMGELNNMWKGNQVGYSGLHRWIGKYFPKPKDGLCQMCHQVPLEEAANITGILNREFKNWAWFCYKCHKLFDNIIERNLRIPQYIRNNK